MSNNSSEFHWGEGMKYALEGIKILFVLNGASAVSILTFIGNTKICVGFLVCSLISFALGALMGVSTMMCAYLTQLQYGNAAPHTSNHASSKSTWGEAQRLHNVTYVCVGLGILFFLMGVGFAAWALSNLPPSVLVK